MPRLATSESRGAALLLPNKNAVDDQLLRLPDSFARTTHLPLDTSHRITVYFGSGKKAVPGLQLGRYNRVPGEK